MSDPFDDAVDRLVELIGSNAPDDAIELRARSISLAFGPQVDDVVALALSEVALAQYHITQEFRREFPDFCQRR